MVLVATGALSVTAASTAAVVTWPSGSASATPVRLTADVQSDTAYSSSQLAREEANAQAFMVSLANAEKAAAAAKAAAAKKAAAEAAAKKKAAEEAAAKKKQEQAEKSGTPEQIAQAMLSKFGWSSGQFSCLQPLWARESGWSVTAYNAGSGAYGLPQALPGSKMGSAGPDWQSSAYTQIKWGLGYIKDMYGSPCGAWDHEEADGWY